jgi:hypothetical protein
MTASQQLDVVNFALTLCDTHNVNYAPASSAKTSASFGEPLNLRGQTAVNASPTATWCAADLALRLNFLAIDGV